MKNKEVLVKLNDNTEFKGLFKCIDASLNVVLEKSEEVGTDNRF